MLDLSKPENPSKSQNLINNGSRRVSSMRKRVDFHPMEVMNTVKTRCVSRDVKLTGKIWRGPDRIVQGRSKIVGAARYYIEVIIYIGSSRGYLSETYYHNNEETAAAQGENRWASRTNSFCIRYHH